MPTAAWVFFGVIAIPTIIAIREFGVVNGLKTDIAGKLPGGHFLRVCLLQPDVALGRVLSRVSLNPARWALGTALFGIFLGGTIFSLAEKDASLPDGWWWAFVSMSTVGYGDISPATTFMRFLATFVIATGIASTAILTAALAGRIAEQRMVKRDYEATEELHDDIDALCDDLEGVDFLARLRAISTELRKREQS